MVFRRLQARFSRLINGVARVWPASGRPRSLRTRPLRVPDRVDFVEPWHFRNWTRSTFVSVDAPYHGALPREEFLFPHPALETEEWRKGPFEVAAQFALELPYGRTVGRNGTVLTNDNVILRDVSLISLWDRPDHPLLYETSLPKIKRLRGRYTLLNGHGNSTFHWLYDNIARLEVLRLAGFALDDFDGFLMTRPKYEPHYETLELLGIPPEKIVWCTRARHFECDRLVVSSIPNNGREHHPLVFPFLRRLLRRRPASGGLRLYISRGEAATARRRMVNEAELLGVLEKFGFRAVRLGELGFQEQARLFASAEHIVAPHGGGLSNLCFCNPPASLVELFAPDYALTYFRSLARQLGLGYEALVGEAVGSDEVRSNFGGDMRIDPGQLEAVLRKVLG